MFTGRFLQIVPSAIQKAGLGGRSAPMASEANRRPKCALIDLSGTLHIEDEAIRGAPEALKRLRETIPHVRFVTNTTKESKRLLYERLLKLDFEVDRDEIFTSLTAARSLLEKRKSKPFLLVDDHALEDFSGFELNEEKNCVVVGLAPEKFDYGHMNEAFRLLQQGASLIAIHKARYYKRKDGLALGPGPFVTALEFATGVKADVCGKPEKDFFLAALEGTGCSPLEAVMIGDDVRDDVLGAQQAGLTGILVKTGKYMEGDESKYGQPDVCVKDFPSAVDAICARNCENA